MEHRREARTALEIDEVHLGHEVVVVEQAGLLARRAPRAHNPVVVLVVADNARVMHNVADLVHCAHKLALYLREDNTAHKTLPSKDGVHTVSISCTRAGTSS